MSTGVAASWAHVWATTFSSRSVSSPSAAQLVDELVGGVGRDVDHVELELVGEVVLAAAGRGDGEAREVGVLVDRARG